jgi:hypothetical protein
MEGSKEELLKRVDDELFVGERRHYERFKDFDYDRDGYVSTNDIRKTFMAKNLMEPSEVEKIVGYLDEKGDGFVDFRSFNKKIKNNMTNTDEHGQAMVRNIMQPSSEHIKLRVKQTASMRNTLSTFKEPFRPTNDRGTQMINLVAGDGSRYGNTPGYSNTFTTFQHMDRTSPMYASAVDP